MGFFAPILGYQAKRECPRAVDERFFDGADGQPGTQLCDRPVSCRVSNARA